MKLKKSKLMLLVTLALQQMSQPAFSQTVDSAAPPASDQSKDAALLPEVKVIEQRRNDYAPGVATVGAKTPTLLRDIPQSLTVINRTVLDEQAATSMTQALRNVPGITITAGEGGAIGDNINLRGFSARTDIFLDGFRDRGQYARDTFAIDAIEVLKGPSSMLFGRGSTGGVINQVSKKPGLKAAGEANVSLGTNDFYRSTVDVNHPLSETSAVRIAAFGQDTKSTRDVVYNKDWGVAPSLRFGIGMPTEVTISALIQRNNDLPDYGFPFVTTNGVGTVRKPVDAPTNRFYGYTDDHFDQSINVIGATVRHKISPTTTLRNQTQYSQYAVDASPSPPGTVTRIGGGVPSRSDPLSQLLSSREDRDRHLGDKSLFNQTDLIAKIQAGSVLHTLTTGLEVGRDEYHEDRFIWNTTTANRNINLGNPVNGTRQGVRALSRTIETSANTLAAYTNDQIDLNKQWKLVGGLRWDRFSVSTDLKKYTLPTVTPAFPADTTMLAAPQSNTMLSHRAGIIYQPNDTQSYYISTGTSFNPSGEAVTQSVTTTAVNGDKVPPEKNRSLETGAKLDLLDGNLSFNTALFHVEKTAARTADATGVVTLNGDVRVQGLELGVVGRFTPAWQVLAGYTLLHGKVLKSNDLGRNADLGIPSEGKTLQNTPRHSASLWSTYSFLRDWDVGGGLVYSSKRYVNNFETAEVDGYTRYDATLAYKQKRYDFRVNLQNLTDEKYFETANAGRAVPVKGRSAIVSITYRFY
ncbi:MAG: TonB-dependent siderophore receptor [Candidatus Nitrotoga sp.]